MKNIHSADKHTLLEAIICTKFKGKAIVDFHTRDITNYEQLRRELTEYLGKRNTAHLQFKNLTLTKQKLKQKTSESAQEFGRRVDNIVDNMELYESMEEGQNHTPEQQHSILDNTKTQALHNYQIGLRDDIKLLAHNDIKPCRKRLLAIIGKCRRKSQLCEKIRSRVKVNLIREPDTCKILYVRNMEKWDTKDANVVQASMRIDFLCLNQKDGFK